MINYHTFIDGRWLVTVDTIIGIPWRWTSKSIAVMEPQGCYSVSESQYKYDGPERYDWEFGREQWH